MMYCLSQRKLLFFPIFFNSSPPPKSTPNTEGTWEVHLLVWDRYNEDRPFHQKPKPCPKSDFRRAHTEVEDRGTGLSKSPFCHRSWRLDGNLSVPWDSPQFTPPWCEMCERVKKRSAYRHGSPWRTGEWVEFKDALKSSLHITRVNQEIRRRGERKEGYNHKVRLETHNGIPEWGLMKRSMVYSFIKKRKKEKTHWVVASACINSVLVGQLKYAYFRSGSEKAPLK